MLIASYKSFQLDKINPIIFITPVIALILVILMFIYLCRKVDNKGVFKRFSFIVLVLAFVLNFVWELGQMPLYKEASYNLQHIAFCALASFADAIMVFLIYFSFALIYKKPLWIQELTAGRFSILVFVGCLGAILAEMRHVSVGNWAYNKYMPIIPIVDVGFSPVFQFMMLPICIYYFSFKITKTCMKQNF